MTSEHWPKAFIQRPPPDVGFPHGISPDVTDTFDQQYCSLLTLALEGITNGADDVSVQHGGEVEGEDTPQAVRAMFVLRGARQLEQRKLPLAVL